MLALLAGLILPLTRRQHIPAATSCGLILALWVCSLIAVRACVKARRRRYSYGWQQAYPQRTGQEEEKAPAAAEAGDK